MGRHWNRKDIMAYYDNEAVVATMNEGDSQEEECVRASNAVSCLLSDQI